MVKSAEFTRALTFALSSLNPVRSEEQRRYELVSFRMGARSFDSEALIAFAHQSLRFISWQHVTRELMASNAACPDWERITNHLDGGQHIDLFMSHSWHADAAAKYAALETVAAKFQMQ